MTAKKTPAKKAPAKRKSRAKKPVTPNEVVDFNLQQLLTKGNLRKRLNAKGQIEVYSIKRQPIVDAEPWQNWQQHLKIAAASVVMLLIGAAGGVWSSGGIAIGPGREDVLSQAYGADRVTQVAVLKELAQQPFDGATDDGRKQAGEWFNAQRFRNSPDDFGPYTDEVSEAIAANSEAELAAKLENVK